MLEVIGVICLVLLIAAAMFYVLMGLLCVIMWVFELPTLIRTAFKNWSNRKS